MKQLISLISLALLLLATASPAQIDPGPDGFGIYFDEGATQVSAEIGPDPGSITAYMVLTNPSLEGGIQGWLAGVSAMDGNPSIAMVFGHPTVGTNISTNMPGSGAWLFNVSISPEAPLPLETITVLAILEITPYVFDTPIPMYVTQHYNPGGYGIGGDGASFQPSSGSWDLPVAVINGAAPVAVDSRSWDDLKALYR